MNKEIAKKVKTILLTNYNDKVNEEMIKAKSNLLEIGLDSLVFLNVVVLIEKEFRVNFENDLLDINNFKDFQNLIDYIESKIVAIKE